SRPRSATWGFPLSTRLFTRSSVRSGLASGAVGRVRLTAVLVALALVVPASAVTPRLAGAPPPGAATAAPVQRVGGERAAGVPARDASGVAVWRDTPRPPGAVPDARERPPVPVAPVVRPAHARPEVTPLVDPAPAGGVLSERTDTTDTFDNPDGT